MFRTFRDKGLVWPLVIISLLLSSVLMMVGVVFMARSDGGAQVIDNYYEKAVAWDSLNASQQAFGDKGWVTSVVLSDDIATLVVWNANRVKVAHLSGSVELTRPQSAEAGSRIELAAMNSDSTYTFTTGTLDKGLWDFKFSVSHQTIPLAFTVRKEIR